MNLTSKLGSYKTKKKQSASRNAVLFLLLSAHFGEWRERGSGRRLEQGRIHIVFKHIC